MPRISSLMRMALSLGGALLLTLEARQAALLIAVAQQGLAGLAPPGAAAFPRTEARPRRRHPHLQGPAAGGERGDAERGGRKRGLRADARMPALACPALLEASSGPMHEMLLEACRWSAPAPWEELTKARTRTLHLSSRIWLRCCCCCRRRRLMLVSGPCRLAGGIISAAGKEDSAGGQLRNGPGRATAPTAGPKPCSGEREAAPARVLDTAAVGAVGSPIQRSWAAPGPGGYLGGAWPVGGAACTARPP
ncbi:hypothetical protein CDD83_9385 [Cordyceps sp. RAO-2017]|nr:hypothetical protein CDD83_9385 [Cordyceps sp. RAO-2017]